MAAAALMLALAASAHAQGIAAPSASPAPQSAGAPPAPWKQLYDDNQTAFYVDPTGLPKTGAADVTSLLQYKVAQVIGGNQVWSILTHMKVKCDENQVLTTDNTLYALKMGTGPVVEAQPANDSWHTPIAGSLGGMVWKAACATP